MTLNLTEEQQAIIRHNYGPALVFAVAGSGKTTAMVHRIERLVREELFAPAQILATSFSLATIRSVVDGLAAWQHCTGVKPLTLHAFGNRLIKRAERQGLIKPFAAGKDEPTEDRQRQLLWQTLYEARRQQVEWRKSLDGLDLQDFLEYVAACKAQLAYADLAGTGLPPDARKIAVQAKAPDQLPWYLDLYRLYEEVRLRERVLTFDDMLLHGWELLVKFPLLLGDMRKQYRCVLVDEYQDINRAQAEILELITYPERNYMAIGDDDQTIYEWRGADPGYILDFCRRYQATVYHIQDNFRCSASQVALANQVIRHNTRREKKMLFLTKGFAGTTILHSPETDQVLAAELVAEVMAQRQAGVPLREQVVLVRLYAQTPLIEQQLTTLDIPYRVIGSTPFYARPEVACLVQYLALLPLETKQARGEALTPAEEQARQDAWFCIYNNPTRYLSRAFAEEALVIAGRDRVPLSEALLRTKPQSASSAPGEARLLSILLASLARRAEQETTAQIMQSLLEQTGYRAHLLATSAVPGIGEGKVATVDAFVHYAAAFPTIPALLAHLVELRRRHAATEAAEDFLVLTTIFRAKGREWPIVYVPHCHEGTLPFMQYEVNIEEERRLLYVAITRAKRELHLYACRDEKLSSFLQQAHCVNTLAAIPAIEQALSRPPHTWGGRDTVVFAQQTQRLGITRYFTHWLGDAELVGQIARQIAGCNGILQRRGDGLARLMHHLTTPWQPFLTPDTPELTDPALLEELLTMPDPFAGAKPKPPTPFSAGETVKHPIFGTGTVCEVKPTKKGNTRIVVDFAGQGRKTLVLELAQLEKVKSNS